MDEHQNNQIPPEENASQNTDEQNWNDDLSYGENAPQHDFWYTPPQYTPYVYNEQPNTATGSSGCLGLFVKTILILAAIIAFAFFACLFMLSGPC